MSTTEVEKAEKIVCQLEEQLETLLGRTVTLHKERAAVSYAALTANNPTAKARLDAINAEALQHSNEVASVECAIAEAKQRLEAAQQAGLAAADRDAALQLREKLNRFVSLGLLLDDCIADFLGAAKEMDEVLDEIHALGCVTPTDAQMRVLGTLAIKTQGLCWFQN